MSDRKAILKVSDMSDDMQRVCIEVSMNAIDKYHQEKDMAVYIKQECDRRYGPSWHCVVGRNFGCRITHESKHFVYFYVGQIAVMLFKAGK